MGHRRRVSTRDRPDQRQARHATYAAYVFGRILLALIVVPVVELYVVYQVSGFFGFLPTVAILLAISFAGAWLVRREGAGAWKRIQETLSGGNIPSNELADGALIVFGGTLLLTPGFFTDALGLAMLIPFLRAPVRNYIVKRTSARAKVATADYTNARFGKVFGQGFGASGFGTSGGPFGGDVVDVEEVDITRTNRPTDTPPAIDS